MLQARLSSQWLRTDRRGTAHLGVGHAQAKGPFGAVAHEHPRGEAAIGHVLVVVKHSHDDALDGVIPRVG